MIGPWWCAECGAPAELAADSLDPRHPLGICMADERPCGRAPQSRARNAPKLPPHARPVLRLVPVLNDRDEVAAVMRTRRAAAARRTHRAHLADRGRLVSGCELCSDLARGLRLGHGAS